MSRWLLRMLLAYHLSVLHDPYNIATLWPFLVRHYVSDSWFLAQFYTQKHSYLTLWIAGVFFDVCLFIDKCQEIRFRTMIELRIKFGPQSSCQFSMTTIGLYVFFNIWNWLEKKSNLFEMHGWRKCIKNALNTMIRSTRYVLVVLIFGSILE